MKIVNPQGAHVHAKPPNGVGEVDGYRIVGFAFEDGDWSVQVTMDNENVISYSELELVVRPKKLEVVPFGVLDDCCNLNRI